MECVCLKPIVHNCCGRCVRVYQHIRDACEYVSTAARLGTYFWLFSYTTVGRACTCMSVWVFSNVFLH